MTGWPPGAPQGADNADHADEVGSVDNASNLGDAGCITPPVTGTADAAGGADASFADVLRIVGKATFGPDLIAPGPRLWPIGRKARERRAQRRNVAELAQQRRAELRGMLASSRPAPVSKPWRPVSPWANARVIAGLVLVVAAVVVSGVWLSARTSTAPNTVPAASLSPVSSSATLLPSTSDVSVTAAPSPSGLPLLAPIPSGGVSAVAPPALTSINPDSVAIVAAPTGPPTSAELSTPAAAASAWLARACPFSFHDSFGAAEQRAKPTMTAAGWAPFDPIGVPADQASWAQTVAAQEVGACSAPVAVVDPEAPRSASSAVVIVTADRVVTGTGESSYVEALRDERVVLLGPDGRWLVDVATQGG